MSITFANPHHHHIEGYELCPSPCCWDNPRTLALVRDDHNYLRKIHTEYLLIDFAA